MNAEERLVWGVEVLVLVLVDVESLEMNVADGFGGRGVVKLGAGITGECWAVTLLSALYVKGG